MRVGVVVVTHGGPSEMLRSCLASLEAAGGACAIVVVDNGATEHATPMAEYGPGATLIVRTDNEGYGAAANRGIETILDDQRLDAVAVVNDDVVVDPDWLTPLVAELDRDPTIGVVQPKMLLADTDPPLLNSLGVQLDAAGAGHDVGNGEPDDGRAEAFDIDIFSGGAVLLSSRFARALKGFDERYFLYYEDVDLALRGAALGWRFRCVPASVVHHRQSATTASMGDRLRQIQERNRLWVAFRFGSPGWIGAAVWLSIRRLRHRPLRAHTVGLTAGLAGAPRRLVERRRAAR